MGSEATGTVVTPLREQSEWCAYSVRSAFTGQFIEVFSLLWWLTTCPLPAVITEEKLASS